MNPREKWEQWQRERARTGRHPTGGSKMPLTEYLVEHARWHASSAVADHARGRPVHTSDVAELEAAFVDLRDLARERGVL